MSEAWAAAKKNAGTLFYPSSLLCLRALCYIPRLEMLNLGDVIAAFLYTDNVGFQDLQNFRVIIFTSIVGWYPIPPASHQSVTRPGAGFSSEVAANLFMLDFHQSGEYELCSAPLCSPCPIPDCPPLLTQTGTALPDTPARLRRAFRADRRCCTAPGFK